MSERNDAKIKGFVGPLIIDKEEFQRNASSRVYDRLTVDDLLLPFNNHITYESTFEGKLVYIHNCKCMTRMEIIQNKLVFAHTYGGGESNRESTQLLWNGEYYQNSKGEYIVDLIVYSTKCDLARALIRDRKVLDISPVQVKGANLVWINLLGYDRLIEYTY